MSDDCEMVAPARHATDDVCTCVKLNYCATDEYKISAASVMDIQGCKEFVDYIIFDAQYEKGSCSSPSNSPLHNYDVCTPSGTSWWRTWRCPNSSAQI